MVDQNINPTEIELGRFERFGLNAKRFVGVAGLATGAYMIADSAKTLSYDLIAGNIDKSNQLDYVLAIPGYAAGWVIAATGFGMINRNDPDRVLEQRRFRAKYSHSNSQE